jgi:hypothetical protein
VPGRKSLPANSSGDGDSQLTARLTGDTEIDPGLARVAAAWPSLPGHVKAAVLALVESGRGADRLG